MMTQLAVIYDTEIWTCRASERGSQHPGPPTPDQSVYHATPARIFPKLLKLVLDVSNEDQGSHTDDFSVSVNCGIQNYIHI